jgi:glucose-6-phosphate isomerase
MDMLRLDLRSVPGLAAAAEPRLGAALARLQQRAGTDQRWLDTDLLAAAHEQILEFAESMRGRVHTLVTLSVGASALPVQALRTALNSPFHNLTMPGGLPRLIVLDNIDPDLIGEFLDCVDPSECLFHVVSRSGESEATLALTSLLRGELARRLGPEGHKERVVITTNAHSGTLHELAEREGYTRFDIPDGVQGRYAALSPVGLLPAALLGIDTPGLLAGARDMAQLARNSAWIDNPALAWAAVHDAQRRAGRDCVIHASFSHRLRDLSAYAAQLSHESGLAAVHAPGVLERHHQLGALIDSTRVQWFSVLSVLSHDHQQALPGTGTLNALHSEQCQQTLSALELAGIPHVRVQLPRVSAHALGQYFQFQQTAAALSADLAAA